MDNATARILDPLLNIMPPPTEPVECGTWEDWIRIQRYLGTRLPIDYKRFINTYGSGQAGEFLWVYNPFSKGYLNLLERVFSDLGSLRAIKAEFGLDQVPYPLYAEPGGLLPWGHTINGDALYWLTNGENPDQWTIAINETRSPIWEEHQGYFVTFMTKFVSGELASKIFDGKWERKLLRKHGSIPFTPSVEEI